jgi:hypothetical protein
MMLLQCVLVCALSSKLKTMTALCLTAGARDLLVGTEAGNIHTVELPEMKLSSVVIFQEIVLQKLVLSRIILFCMLLFEFTRVYNRRSVIKDV